MCALLLWLKVVMYVCIAIVVEGGDVCVHCYCGECLWWLRAGPP